LALNEKVTAQWKDGNYYKAIIKRKLPEGYLVDYFQYGEMQYLRRDKIRKIQPNNMSQPSISRFPSQSNNQFDNNYPAQQNLVSQSIESWKSEFHKDYLGKLAEEESRVPYNSENYTTNKWGYRGGAGIYIHGLNKTCTRKQLARAIIGGCNGSPIFKLKFVKYIFQYIQKNVRSFFWINNFFC